MKMISRAMVLAGFAALAACGDTGADEANNLDANLDMNAMTTDMNMPADNMTVDANNVTVIDNGTADMNATDTTTTDTNTTTNGY